MEEALLSDDQDTVVCALQRVRRILTEHIAGRRDAAWTVERLRASLDKTNIETALDRLDRRRLLRLLD
jgi:hypothetical protein